MKATQIARIVILTLAVASASCGSTVRQGTGTSFLIVNELEFARGNEPESFTANLLSDVITVVDDVPTFFNDLGRVTFSLGLKDPGPAGSPTQPTQNQFITVDRYHVRFFRADGRNTQGVDVPYEFDGAFTVTVGSSQAEAGFTIVRNIAKREAPLQALRTNGLILSTIAEITFYGRDQTGHEVVATARTSVDFANFGD
ncbi:MAG TPA: hypothetical protein VFT47_08015 [Vicinamibacterales bacterium]|nr:hypothetical protein [Vicinamibacterales bacterium]